MDYYCVLLTLLLNRSDNTQLILSSSNYIITKCPPWGWGDCQELHLKQRMLSCCRWHGFAPGVCALTLLLGLAKDLVTDTSNNWGSAESYGPISCTEHVQKTDATIETSLSLHPIQNQQPYESHNKWAGTTFPNAIYTISKICLPSPFFSSRGRRYSWSGESLSRTHSLHMSYQSIQNTRHLLFLKSN